jgi:ABC-2 type transport system ATP-binding protein
MVGMDPAGQHKFKDLLRKAAEAGAAILLSTHMLDTAERLCSRVTVLHRGRNLATANLDELRQKAKAGADASLEEVFMKLIEEASQPEPPPTWPVKRRFGRF